jgi:GntR family transcriptional regulator, transcriptional repressor for pyruvate dehydrogenase complex
VRSGAGERAKPDRRNGYVAVAVTDSAIERIKDRILSGELRPGQRLPREADLAEELGISRNSLREAVGALSVVNILHVRHGDGTYVTSLDPPLLLEALSFVADFHRDDSLLDFLEVRRILEPAATALAARHISADEVAQLKSMTSNVSLRMSVNKLVDYDLRFHTLVADSSGNSVLASLIRNLEDPTTRVRIWRALTQQTALERTVREHSGIIDALEAREPEIAAVRAVVHIAGVEEWLRRAAPDAQNATG